MKIGMATNNGTEINVTLRLEEVDVLRCAIEASESAIKAALASKVITSSEANRQLSWIVDIRENLTECASVLIG